MSEFKAGKCMFKTVEIITNIGKQDETVCLLCYIPSYYPKIILISENIYVLYVLLGEKSMSKDHAYQY